MVRIIVITAFLILNILSIQAQTSDLTEGCVPVEISFTAPDLTDYYWDFGDGATSDLQNPNHVYTTSGNFTASLYEGVNGDKIGDIELNIYPDPEITIISTIEDPCDPSRISFSTDIVLDDNIEILSYLWDFGDGQSSTEVNPIHKYNFEGTYDVYVQIKTNIPECDKTESIKDIEIEKNITTFFTANVDNICVAPTFINFTNFSTQGSEYTYVWDFGNGATFEGYTPDPILYNQPGEYTITLTVFDSEGCEVSHTVTVSIGKFIFNLNVNPEACISIPLNFSSFSNVTSHFWDFGNGASPPNSDESLISVIYDTGGPKTVTYSVETSDGCAFDTTFSVYIQDPQIEINIDPDSISCTDNFTISLEASVDTFAQYEWGVNGIIGTGSTFEYTYEEPVRDSFYIDRALPFQINLAGVTDIGCVAKAYEAIYLRNPYAYFVVDKSRGCAPLTVAFKDSSFSQENIIRWEYLYGNGETEEFNSYTNHEYTFEEPGEYLVKLIIENENGCIDTTGGIYILVGEPIPSAYEIDKTEICLGDTVNINFTNDDPRIHSYNFTTDENRVNHCWQDSSGYHVFSHNPGTYPLTVTTEYNGCYWDETIEDAITVNGVKAQIGYQTDCSSPFNVDFINKGLGDGELSWNIQDSIVDDDDFNFLFETKGEKKVILTAIDPNSSCPADIDSTIIHITKPEAKFTVDSLVCDNRMYTLNATPSIDVDTRCGNNYLWILPDEPRPRKIKSPTIETSFSQRGINEATLIIEDINGCEDTLTQKIISYGIEPSFLPSETIVCLPAEIDFTDSSTSDTTIVEWEWDFGSNEQNPTHIFNNPGVQSISVNLTVTDEIGCQDEIVLSIEVYEPETTISIDQGPQICVGEEINFTATDFTSMGSFLNYEWSFGPFGTGSNMNESVIFDQSGEYIVNLIATEDDSGCITGESVTISVFDYPVAGFETPLDDAEYICFPEILEFTNTSTSSNPLNYQWDFDTGSIAFAKNPVKTFEKGTYEVTMIATVQGVGCADTISKTYTLVGPEGDLILDKNSICTGESVNFDVTNLVDVSEYTLDYGDGITQDNTAPVDHTYNFNPPSGVIQVSLVLKTEATGCETIQTDNIEVKELNADFEILNTSYCEGLAVFENLSSGDFDNVFWDFGNGVTSTELNPTLFYSELGTYNVELRIADNEMICNHSIIKEITLEEVGELVKFPNVFSPNNDNQNDYFNVYIDPEYAEYITITNFKVYNRWGNLVYNNETPDLGWDGKYNGNDSPAEVYAYYIEVEITDCNNKVSKGNVTIVR